MSAAAFQELLEIVTSASDGITTIQDEANEENDYSVVEDDEENLNQNAIDDIIHDFQLMLLNFKEEHPEYVPTEAQNDQLRSYFEQYTNSIQSQDLANPAKARLMELLKREFPDPSPPPVEAAPEQGASNSGAKAMGGRRKSRKNRKYRKSRKQKQKRLSSRRNRR